MEASTVSGVTFKYIADVFGVNFVLKIIVGIWTLFLVHIYEPNELLIKIIVFLFLIDLLLGVIKAVKYKLFSSFQFLRGVFKLAVYGVLLAVGYSVDKALPVEFVLSLMFSFIIITDASSVLENLEQLGFSTPPFLRKILKIHREKYFIDQVEKFTGYDLKDKYLQELKRLEEFLDKIENKNKRKLMYVRLVNLRGLVIDIDTGSILSKDHFMANLNMQFISISEAVKRSINQVNIPKEKKKECIGFFQESIARIKVETEQHLNVPKEKFQDEEFVIQVKNNLKQMIITELYKQISEHIKIKQ